jgi:hypothetical protein
MDVSIFTDPVKVGPGIWFKMHIDARKAITDSLKEAFIVNINALCDNFKCKKCQSHFRQFIDTHPFQSYWNIRDSKGRDIGFFQWTWELHNQVNRFLKKYEPSLEEAYEFYSNIEAGACFNCGGLPKEKEEVPFQLAITRQSNLDISFSDPRIQLPEQRSRAIPPILTLYRDLGEIKSQPFKLIPRN